MKKIALIILLAVAGVTFAQNDEAYVDILVSEFTEKLENRDINSWFYTKRYCLGEIEMFTLGNGKMCTSKGTYFAVYVFWQEEGKTMIKKIDNCGLFYSLPLKDSGIFDFYLSYNAALAGEEVKPYRGANTTGKPELRTAVEPCSHSYTFTNNGEMFDKTFNLYALSTDDKNPNLNYEHNQSLKIVELDKHLDEVIVAVDNSFRRLSQ